jgi:hypothetical protein
MPLLLPAVRFLDKGNLQNIALDHRPKELTGRWRTGITESVVETALARDRGRFGVPP